MATFRTKEQQIFLEVKQQIILLVLKRTAARAQQTFGPKKQAEALINETINKLEGELLGRCIESIKNQSLLATISAIFAFRETYEGAIRKY